MFFWGLRLDIFRLSEPSAKNNAKACICCRPKARQGRALKCNISGHTLYDPSYRSIGDALDMNMIIAAFTSLVSLPEVLYHA